MVSFNSIPSALRVPFVAAEFDASRAAQGPALLAFSALLIGQKLSSAPAAANSIHKVTNADQVATLCGRGSQLHRQALAWFAANRSTECWIGVLADNSAGVIASGSVTLAGTAAEDGVLSLYVGGNVVQVPVSSGDTAAAIAGLLATEIGTRATGTVTFATAAGGDDITVGDTTFVATVGAVTPGAATYSVDTGNNAAAASFAAQVNAHAAASTVVKATADSAVVTLRAIAPGDDGNAVVLTSVDGATTAVTGSGTLAGGVAGENPDLPAHASVSGAVVTIRAANAGELGNQIDLRVNYRDNEATPDGLTVTISAMASGAANPVLTSLIAAMGDTWYHVIAHPFTDATSLEAIEGELADRFGPMRMIDGVAITAKSDTLGNMTTLGDSRNSQHSVIVHVDDSPTWAPEFAAHVAGVAAYYAQIDPARPLQTLPLPWVKAPAEASRSTLQERNQLLFDGISTTRVGAGGLVQIERLITTNQTNAAGSPSTAYLAVESLFTLMYLRYSWRDRIATRYPRHKLADDDARFGSGQAVVTPKIGKAEAIAWFRDMERLGLVGGFDQFKADLVVVRNESDPNRLDFLLPPDLINQLVVVASSIQFKL